MKKQLNSDALMKEFQEGSVFFGRTPAAVPAPLAEAETPIAPLSPIPGAEPDSATDTTIPRHHDTTPDTKPFAAPVVNPLLERTRRSVKHLGKEAATHRFTVDEKKALKKIEHEYALRGIRTSENEITRIAINYLAEEYRQNKEGSVLAQVLELLNN